MSCQGSLGSDYGGGGEGGEAEPKQTRIDGDYKVHESHPTKAVPQAFHHDALS